MPDILESLCDLIETRSSQHGMTRRKLWAWTFTAMQAGDLAPQFSDDVLPDHDDPARLRYAIADASEQSNCAALIHQSCPGSKDWCCHRQHLTNGSKELCKLPNFRHPQSGGQEQNLLRKMGSRTSLKVNILTVRPLASRTKTLPMILKRYFASPSATELYGERSATNSLSVSVRIQSVDTG